jgi:hypothetical protein
MLTDETHVFLGPTLDLQTARHHLWDAHYHPPIQCGDMVRLLRLMPKRIIVIDGLYEQVPAVWHKEIMLALNCGIEVYGAASMGALRAAELHSYGMIGIGIVFQAFVTNQLTDDDEVAVLHQGIHQDLLPLNDAMVNIRATLEHAYQENIIGIDAKQVLTQWCKAQFYPKRSLLQALAQVGSEYRDECSNLHEWIKKHGLIDVKRQDAIAVLKRVQEVILSEEIKQKGVSPENKHFEMPYTKFIASLVDDVVGTPFSVFQSWLPDIEKKLTLLSIQKPDDYRLIIDLAGFIKNAYSVVNRDKLLDDPNQYLSYIEKHDLYVPKNLCQFFRNHPTLSILYPWILHFTCLANITNQRIRNYLPVVVFYFDCEVGEGYESRLELLSWIIFFVLLLHQQLNDQRLTIKRTILDDHLREIRFWDRYKQHKIKCKELNLPNELLNIKIILDFVMVYMKVLYIHQGVKDFNMGLAESPAYFHWIYDALMLYEKTDF